MEQFILIGIAILIVFGVLKWQKRWSTMVTVSMVFVIAATVALLLFLPERKVLSGAAWYQTEPYSWILIYSVMLIGMFVSVFTKAIEARKIALSQCVDDAQRKAVRLAVDRYDFLYSFLLSFLTFSSIYAQLKGHEITFISVILAFQTGFFWESVVSTVQKKYEKV